MLPLTQNLTLFAVETQRKMEVIDIIHAQFKTYSVTFLALRDANSSITSLKLMYFAISYSIDRMLKFDSLSYAMDDIK
jgi:hypothetical protein